MSNKINVDSKLRQVYSRDNINKYIKDAIEYSKQLKQDDNNYLYNLYKYVSDKLQKEASDSFEKELNDKQKMKIFLNTLSYILDLNYNSYKLEDIDLFQDIINKSKNNFTTCDKKDPKLSNDQLITNYISCIFSDDNINNIILTIKNITKLEKILNSENKNTDKSFLSKYKYYIITILIFIVLIIIILYLVYYKNKNNNNNIQETNILN